jgi:hypothetical protein
MKVMTDAEFRNAIEEPLSPFYFSNSSKKEELLRTIGKVPGYLKTITKLKSRQEKAELSTRLKEWIIQTLEKLGSQVGRMKVVEFLEGALFQRFSAGYFGAHFLGLSTLTMTM